MMMSMMQTAPLINYAEPLLAIMRSPYMVGMAYKDTHDQSLSVVQIGSKAFPSGYPNASLHLLCPVGCVGVGPIGYSRPVYYYRVAHRKGWRARKHRR
jgi:hypothetical protein